MHVDIWGFPHPSTGEDIHVGRLDRPTERGQPRFSAQRDWHSIIADLLPVDPAVFLLDDEGFFLIPDLADGDLGPLTPFADRIAEISLTVVLPDSLEFLRHFPNVIDARVYDSDLKDIQVCGI